MILLLPFIKVLIVITLLLGLWILCGGSVLFAFISVLITGVLVVRQHDFI
ncbi:Phage shock protein G [Kosakonia sp. BK9b]